MNVQERVKEIKVGEPKIIKDAIARIRRDRRFINVIQQSQHRHLPLAGELIDVVKESHAQELAALKSLPAETLLNAVV